MAITVVDLSKQKSGQTNVGITAGNEYIYLVPRNARINFQALLTAGTGDAALKVSLVDKKQIESEGSFASLTQDGDAITGSKILSTFSTTYSAVGLEVTDGTWTTVIDFSVRSDVEG